MCQNMKSIDLFPWLSCVLLLGAGTSIAQANGFFQENKDISSDTMQDEQYQLSFDSFHVTQDDFILDQQNPHNFLSPYNPYNQNSLSLSKVSKIEINKDDPLSKSDIKEFDNELAQKSEKAFRKNRLNAEASLSIEKDELLENEIQMSGIELSQLTSSNLIISAQKKKFFDKLFPALLSDDRIIHQDRRRIELLLSQFEQDNKIDGVDELWLKHLVGEYHILEIGDVQK